MIKALHLDDRLIHGQVAISWTRFLDANVLLVINDEVVKNELRKKALKMAVVSDPQDAAKVCKGVKDVQRLTIGGVRKKAEYITDNLNLTNEDMKALLEVIKTGVAVGMLPTPSDKFVNLEKLLVKALKNQEG